MSLMPFKTPGEPCVGRAKLGDLERKCKARKHMDSFIVVQCSFLLQMRNIGIQWPKAKINEKNGGKTEEQQLFHC